MQYGFAKIADKEGKEFKVKVIESATREELDALLGKDTVLKLAIRMYRTDRTNTARAKVNAGETATKEKVDLSKVQEIQL